MGKTRASQPSDLPRIRTLWALAFGDTGAYVDNFIHRYYRPERVLLLEEEGVVQAMTAWFDTSFCQPGREPLRAAYLYAVATHPNARGRGLAGQLLADVDTQLARWGVEAVTTVPAEPSLHLFFGRNGFRECFTHQELEQPAALPEGQPPFRLTPLSAEQYGSLREENLNGIDHIALPTDAMNYQAGACALSPGGGLYAAETGAGRVLLCVEGLEDGRLLVKELLGEGSARREALTWLPRLLPDWSGRYRTPGEGVPFGMLKWLSPDREAAWDWERGAYLGLAFD